MTAVGQEVLEVEISGSTYIALLDNRLLADVMRSTGIGFQEYEWGNLACASSKPHPPEDR